MTYMSRLCLAVLALGLASLTLAGCEHGCPTSACPQGLIITFDDSFAAGQTFEVTITEPSTVPDHPALETCTFTPGTPNALRCSSVISHREIGNQLIIESYEPKQISLTVSSGGATVLQKTIDLMFVTAEPNGPGCGSCRHALVTVSLP